MYKLAKEENVAFSAMHIIRKDLGMFPHKYNKAQLLSEATKTNEKTGVVEFKNLLESYGAAFPSPPLPPLSVSFLLLPMSDQCLLLSLYEGLL